MEFEVRNVKKLENGNVEFEHEQERYVGSWGDSVSSCKKCIFGEKPCTSTLDKLFGDYRESCGNYKFEKVEDIKMTIKAKDLVVVIDDNGCSNIKNGDIHQVDEVYYDKITLVGKGGTKYFTKRFKKVDKNDIPSPEKEIEDVLKIDIVKIDDKYSYAKIAYQNFDIIKRRDFVDYEINVESCNSFAFSGVKSRLFLCGDGCELDDKPIIIANDLIEELNKRVDAINEKYGIRKKWRAKPDGIYWYVGVAGSIENTIEKAWGSDNIKFDAGNYFKSKEDAENSPLYKAFQEIKSN